MGGGMGLGVMPNPTVMNGMGGGAMGLGGMSPGAGVGGISGAGGLPGDMSSQPYLPGNSQPSMPNNVPRGMPGPASGIGRPGMGFGMPGEQQMTDPMAFNRLGASQPNAFPMTGNTMPMQVPGGNTMPMPLGQQQDPMAMLRSLLSRQGR